MNNQISGTEPAYPIDLYTEEFKKHWNGEKWNGLPVKLLIASGIMKSLLTSSYWNWDRNSVSETALDYAQALIDKYNESVK